ncbi:BrnT family toxin [Granulicella sp. 5B5]|nr:BrnT family toxin [Granulicella sp. 5B5]
MAENDLQFEWDDEKDRTNRIKHGLSFNTGASIFNSPTVEQMDDREDYGEVRYVALGRVETMVLKVVYTIRGPKQFRIISVQRANRHEREFYYRATFVE